MKRKYIIISSLVILMVIGYAAITTILKITGRTSIAENATDFDVYFSRAYVNGVEHNEYISSDGKNINYGINELKSVGEQVVLEYEIKNSSSQYSAEVNMAYGGIETNEYVRVEKEEDFAGIIKAKDKGNGKLIITLIKPVTEDSQIDLDLNLGVEAKEKEYEESDTEVTPGVVEKPGDYSTSGTIVDKDGDPKKDKVVVIEAADGLHYTTTDLDGNFYQDNLPEGTVNIYIFDEETMEEVKNMTLEEIRDKASGHITITTSTTGNQKGENIDLKDVTTNKTDEIKVVEITIGDKTIKKELDDNNEVIFNVDSNENTIDLSGIGGGKQELRPGENRFEITLENGETITIIVNNVKPTGPEITGGTNGYVKEAQAVISVKKAGSALSDIAYYEYLISESEIMDFTGVSATGTTDNEVIITEEGTRYVYYRTVSKNGTTSEWSKGEIVKLDRTSPEVIVEETSSTSNSIAIRFRATDRYSGIEELTCKYGKSELDKNGTIENGICTLNNLEKDTIYNYQICARDKVGNETTCKIGEAGTKEIQNPKITFDNNIGSTGDYYLGQTANVAFNAQNITTPTYYIRTTRKGVSNISVSESCGSGSMPGECRGISAITQLEKDVWYKVSGNISVSYTEAYDGLSELVALTYDGVNYSGKATGTIGKIAYQAADLSYSNSLAPNVKTVQEAIDDLYNRLK